jgi:hypothetical protein
MMIALIPVVGPILSVVAAGTGLVFIFTGLSPINTLGVILLGLAF